MDLLATLMTAEDPLPRIDKWFAYYRRHGVTRFHIFWYHLDDSAPNTEAYTTRLAAPDVTIAKKGRIEIGDREVWFGEYVQSELADRPVILIADSDEFIRTPKLIADLFVDNNWDYIQGELVDRFTLNGATPPTPADADLFQTFPLCNHFTWEAMGAAYTKTPFSRPGVRYRTGFHYVEDAKELNRPPWRVKVDHFKWTDGVVQTIRDRLARGWGGDKYHEECRYFLENYVIDGDRIDLSQVTSWLDLRSETGL